MTTKEFVKAFHSEKQDLLKAYLSNNSQSEVSLLINSLNLTKEQTETLKKVLNSSFTDIFYSILLGLDGCASIGGLEQQPFDIFDEDGNQLCGGKLIGEVEALAYEYFHDSN